VNLGASEQNQVRRGARARITLPDNKSIIGKVERLGRVAQPIDGQNGVGAATIQAFIRLDDPAEASALDAAPVKAEITTNGAKNVLSVPSEALVGKSGGGFAVEVLRDDGQHESIAVELGLFDTANGRIQVEGNLDAGDEVVVPSL
jgi:multidrug efflux pump subunit AcrA (membrane-fusion protein)